MLSLNNIARKRLLKAKLPVHVAIIMDGNGRWARRRGLPRNAGHLQGMETLKKLVEETARLGIQYISVYAFSTENWQRPKAEVDYLMNLFQQTMERDALKLKQNKIALRFIGERSVFSVGMRRSMAKCERMLATNKALCQLNLMINYGSRQEILQAIKRLPNSQKKKLTEKIFSSYLFTSGIPDPDLLIRTSGEFRLSNYLLWQVSYAEFYFTKVLWPDFSVRQFHHALRNYQKRHRRMGKI